MNRTGIKKTQPVPADVETAAASIAWWPGAVAL
jgi:hypothetical protein